MRRGTGRRVLWQACVVGLLVAAVVALPASGVDVRDSTVSKGLLARLSQAVSQRYYAAQPKAAATDFESGMASLKKVHKQNVKGQKHALSSFNFDDLGLPQNEESVGVCSSDTRFALEGTNDYRGILDPVGNFTGWHFSTDSGESLSNEGRLPELSIGGTVVPSGGDPVDVAGSGCSFYAASLNYTVDPNFDFSTEPNGVGVYRSDAATLASCDPSDPNACWPTRRIVAASPNVHGQPSPPSSAHPADFFDKPWMDVGTSGAAGEVVWVVYSDFHMTGPGTDTLDYTVQLQAVRCNAALTTCTDPIVLSGDDEDIQFGDVTIGPDGRVYVTWAQIIGELPGSGGLPSQPQTYVIKSRVAEAGSTSFGPTHVVREVAKPAPFEGLLQANDFRISTYPKNAVALVGGKSSNNGDDGKNSSKKHNNKTAPPRFFVTWEECSARPLDTICEEPTIQLTYSDDLGSTWSSPTTVSKGGVNYFPSISADPVSGQVAVAWFTNRFDQFNSAQDVELAWIDPTTLKDSHRDRLTKPSNEPEADPILQGAFIGDYIEVFAYGKTAWVGFNANYRKETLLDGLLGEGVPVNQQDNYLIRTHL